MHRADGKVLPVKAGPCRAALNGPHWGRWKEVKTVGAKKQTRFAEKRIIGSIA